MSHCVTYFVANIETVLLTEVSTFYCLLLILSSGPVLN